MAPTPREERAAQLMARLLTYSSWMSCVFRCREMLVGRQAGVGRAGGRRAGWENGIEHCCKVEGDAGGM